MLVDLSNASFIVEAGCYVGTSTKVWASALADRGVVHGDRVVLAIDAWLGDLNSWVQRIDKHSREQSDDVLADGRSTLYDQFMLNMLSSNRTLDTVIPFSTTSMVGARWLWLNHFEADLVYLDTVRASDCAMAILSNPAWLTSPLIASCLSSLTMPG